MSSFMIPNSIAGGAPQAAYTDQAEPDSIDFDIIAEGVRGNGVLNGCAVTAQLTPDNTVAVSAGVIAYNGQRIVIAGTTSPTMGADPSKNRFYLVCATTSATIIVTAGAPDDNPVFPTIPANSVVLASVFLPAAGSTVITTAMITSKRMLQDASLLADAAAFGRSVNAGTLVGATAALTESTGAQHSTVDVDGSTTYQTAAVTGTHNVASFAQTVTVVSIAVNIINGVSSALTLQGTGTPADVAGVRVLTAVQTTGGTTGLVSGVDADVDFNGSAGSVTKAVALRGRMTGTIAGTITDAVGLEILTLSPAATNKWGFQIGNFNSYHQGSLRVGSNQPPASATNVVLQVNRTRNAGVVTDRGILVDGAVTVQSASTVHHTVHTQQALTTQTGVKPTGLMSGGTFAPTMTATGGATEFVGVVAMPSVTSGTVDNLVGVHASPRLAATGGSGSAGGVFGILVDYANGGTGAAIGITGMRIASGGFNIGIEVQGAIPSIIEGSLTIGADVIPSASTALDIQSTTGALRVPRVANTAAIATPATGMIVFDVSANATKEYTGTLWRTLSSAMTIEQGKAIGDATVANAATRSTINFVGDSVYVKDDSTNNKVDVQVVHASVSPKSGNYYVTPENHQNNTTNVYATARTTGELFLVPVFISHRDGALISISEMGVLVTATGYTVTTAPRLALYNSDSDGYPTTKVFSDGTGGAGPSATSGITSINITAAGYANTVFNTAIQLAPAKYWAALWVPGATPGGTGTLLASNIGTPGVPQIGAPTVAIPATSGLECNVAGTVNGTNAPTTLVGATLNTVGNAPVIYLKVA